MDLNEYQEAAQGTNLIAHREPEVRQEAALMGLVSETGSLLDAHKKMKTASFEAAVGEAVIRQELGDLLWYVAAVARAYDIDLEDLAQENLKRTRDGYQVDPNRVRRLDIDQPETQRFPERVTIKFEQYEKDGRLYAHLTLVDAVPNAFPGGATLRPGKSPIGYTIGAPIGDQLTDNARRVDGYRFHDAIHLGFMALLGWSPTLRSVLGVKRRDDGDADEGEDSARPVYAEEGLAAILYRLSEKRMGFRHELNIDGEIIDMVKGSLVGTEAEHIPGWAWRKAIIEGFRVIRELIEGGGGIVTADLEQGTLEFEPT